MHVLFGCQGNFLKRSTLTVHKKKTSIFV